MRAISRTKDWEFRIGAVVLTLALIGLALVPGQVLEPKFGDRSIAFSPKTFPTITLTVMALCGAFMSARALLARTDVTPTPPGGPLGVRVLAPLCIMLAYVLLMEPLGTPIASAVAIAAMAYSLGNRNWLTILIIAIVVPTMIWVGFRMLLKVFLPAGWLLEGVL